MARSWSVKGVRDTTSVEIWPLATMKIDPLGSRVPRSSKAAAARLTLRPVSSMASGVYQRLTVKTPCSVR